MLEKESLLCRDDLVLLRQWNAGGFDGFDAYLG